MKTRLSLITAILIAFLFSAALLQYVNHGSLAATSAYPQPDLKTLVFASGFINPDNLDPALAYDTTSLSYIYQIYEPLLFYNREKINDFVPMLADSWSISLDGMNYTFHIREGVKFHNGNPLTASDVAYTIQRGLLQGGSGSPQWMLSEPLLGVGIDDVSLLVDPIGNLYNNRPGMQAANPAKLLAACNTVKQAVVADDATGLVTMNLAQPFSPFLHVLANWGWILDREWTASQGAWSGDCSTWQNHYATTTEETPLKYISNGTGPFRFQQYTAGQQVVLSRNTAYWRTDPIWSGGPSGLPAIEQVYIISEPSQSVREQMLLDGSADMIAQYSLYDKTLLDSKSLVRYTAPDVINPILHNPNGVLRAYERNLSPSATDIIINFNIYPSSGGRNYIGSGQFDGFGVPANFFSDIHVRRAFNYAFNYDGFYQNVFGGQAIRRRGPIPANMYGYNPESPIYNYDLTSAATEFAQAWGGQVTSHGFTLTMSYNSGNTYRSTALENLKLNIESLSPLYHVNLLELDWSSYLSDQRDRALPLFFAGWVQDYPHPYNWLQPFLRGTYASRQSMPEDMRNNYSAMLSSCIVLVGGAQQDCYAAIQEQTNVDAPDIFLAQQIFTIYTRSEVHGYYANSYSVSSFPYFYALSKTGTPNAEIALAGQPHTFSFDTNAGAHISLSLPAAEVTQTITLISTPETVSPGAAPSNFVLGRLGFDLTVFANGSPIEFIPNQPVLLTIEYSPQSIGPIIEDTYTLFRWDGTQWVDAACGQVQQDMELNKLIVPICHLSQFAIGGETNTVFLPLINR